MNPDDRALARRIAIEIDALTFALYLMRDCTGIPEAMSKVDKAIFDRQERLSQLLREGGGT